MIVAEIKYDDFIRIFMIGPENLNDWFPGLEVRPDGLYVKDPKAYEGCYLCPEELATLTEHPTGNISDPALAFPCSKKELIDIINFYGLIGCYDRKALEKVPDEHNKVDEDHASESGEVYENAFIRKGTYPDEIWEIWFQGKKMEPIKHIDGMTYIATLLCNRSPLIHVTALCDTVQKRQETPMIGEENLTDSLQEDDMSISTMQDEALDEQAKEEIKRRIIELKKTIKEIDLPKEEITQAKNELEQIYQSLAAYGKNQLSRRAPKKVNESVKADLDRARTAIKRACTKIRKQSPLLADHLETSIKSGTRYCYDNIDNISWTVLI